MQHSKLHKAVGKIIHVINLYKYPLNKKETLILLRNDGIMFPSLDKYKKKIENIYYYSYEIQKETSTKMYTPFLIGLN